MYAQHLEACDSLTGLKSGRNRLQIPWRAVL